MSQDTVKKARNRLSRERGTIRKDWGGRIPIALIYPNSYYLGMSNLGLQTIYSLLNSYDDIVCERFFRERDGVPLSLESQRPLSDFQVLAFSISYELDYFNVVRLLKSGSIPLFADDRDERHPLIIAGGPCITANPEPLSPILDCFAIGEGEAILPYFIDALAQGTGDRQGLLKGLPSLPGIYVPSIPGQRVSRQWVEDIDEFGATSVVLTPDTELGGIYLIEISRGCGWGCRFCLAGYAFRPMRFRSTESLLEQAREGLRYRKRLGLVGASVSDHPDIDELVTELQKMGAELSVSSLRVRPISRLVLRGLAKGGTKTVSLAPEAGSERLRRVINKGIAQDDILRAVDEVAKEGLHQLKLYFMIGLPTETDDDIVEIIKLTLACKETIDRQKAGTHITITITPFIPKAGTPFQWLPMARPEILEHRLSLIKGSLPKRGIDIKSESVGWSTVEGILARGDSRLASALVNGSEGSLSAWHRALERCGLDEESYAHREFDPAERLPWSRLDLGVDPQYLRDELSRSKRGTHTSPCPRTECHECGVC